MWRRGSKILFVHHATALGGAEHSLLILLKHLDRARFVPHLATPPGALAAAARRLGVVVHEVPLAKLQWSHLAQTLAELAVDLLGPLGMLSRGGPDAVDGGSWNRLFVFQRYTSIGAGTTEVQKNIIADRAINLPRK